MRSITIALTTVCLLCFLSPVRSAPSFHWRTGPEMPSAHDYLGCGVVNDLFVVAGGAYWQDGKKLYRTETIAYSPSSGKWTRLPHLPRAGAYGACAVMHDSRGSEQLLIAGGANEDEATSACYRLIKDKSRFLWKRLADLPRPLFGASGAVAGDRFLVFGGAPGMDEEVMRNARPTLLELQISAGTGPASRWKEHPSMNTSGAPSARVGCAAAVSGKRLFVFGGYGVQPDGTLGNFGDAYVLDLSKSVVPKWRRIADLPVPSRWTSAVALDDRHIGLFGGYRESPEKGFMDTVLVYDTENDEYTSCAGIPHPTAVMASGLGKHHTVYLAGGEDRERNRSALFFIGRFVPGVGR